ncbi:MAG: phosphoglycerate kinase, partial [Minisyncoccia bacterium]
RDAVRTMHSGEILVLENVRRNRGEKMNDPAFSEELAALADVFVQDSFDTCHRAHASIVGVPKLLPSYAGLLLEEEVRELRKALTPKSPSLAVIGGAKFSTKEAVLTTLLEKYDHVFVGGALANDFLKAMGHEVGKSLVSLEIDGGMARIASNPKLLLPIDSLVVPAGAHLVSGACTNARVANVTDIRADEAVLDHGPDTITLLASLAHDTKSVLWNGPLGNYENGFIDATDSFARAVAASGAHSVVGGGDTIASIESLGLLSQFSFVSTGGGAMLDFLAKGTLPGIDALN